MTQGPAQGWIKPDAKDDSVMLVVDNNAQTIWYELSEQLGVRSVKQESEQRLEMDRER